MTSLRLRFTAQNAARGRYADPMGGDRLAAERRRPVPTYYPPNHGKRYCEGCQQYQPKPSGKAVKGWRCPACKAVALNPPTQS